MGTQKSEDEKNPVSPCELSIRFPNEEMRQLYLKMLDRNSKNNKPKPERKPRMKPKVVDENTNSQKMLEEKIQDKVQGSFEENASSSSSVEDYLRKRTISSLALENTENEDSNATKPQESSVDNTKKKLKVETPTFINEVSTENKGSPQSNL